MKKGRAIKIALLLSALFLVSCRVHPYADSVSNAQAAGQTEDH